MASQPPRRVLIAIDGSPTSMYAFQWFKDWFIKDRDDVSLFHCKEPESYTTFFRASTSSKSKVESQEKINSLELIETLGELASNSSFKCMVIEMTSSKPGDTIVKVCEEQKMDIVILGSRGTRVATKRTTVGSVAEYVTQNAKLPTVLCPLPPEIPRPE